MFSRKQVAVLGAEFIGTGVLALVMLSVQHSSIGLPYFVAVAAGLALAAIVSIMSGNGANHFNPAITIGAWSVRQIKTTRAVTYIVAQMLGAWGAYWLYTFFVKTTLQPIGGNYDGRILVAEATGAFVLSLAFAAASYGAYENSRKAVTVGAAYALAVVIAASAAIGIVNPAIALSMRAFDVFGPMGWSTYALGPIVGAIIGFNLFALLFAPESSLVRVRAAVSERLNRRRAASATAAAASAKATPATTEKSVATKRSTKSATKRTARSTRGRKAKTTRSRK